MTSRPWRPSPVLVPHALPQHHASGERRERVDCFYDSIKAIFQLGLAVLEATEDLCSSKDDSQF